MEVGVVHVDVEHLDAQIEGFVLGVTLPPRQPPTRSIVEHVHLSRGGKGVGEEGGREREGGERRGERNETWQAEAEEPNTLRPASSPLFSLWKPAGCSNRFTMLKHVKMSTCRQGWKHGLTYVSLSEGALHPWGLGRAVLTKKHCR